MELPNGSNNSDIVWGFHYFPISCSSPTTSPAPKQPLPFPQDHYTSHCSYFLMKSFPQFSSFPSNPLFSSFVTIYTLVLLYFPAFFLKILFSPVLVSTGILFLYLLRLGAARKRNGNPISHRHETETATYIPRSENTGISRSEVGSSPNLDPDPDPDQEFFGSFVEWDVSAPLEVIHEAFCEGEEDGEAADDAVSRQMLLTGVSVIERYPSLSRYYPETDSDSDSNSSTEEEFPVIGGFGCSPERVCFRWVDEEIDEERDGLIEIELDSDCGKRKVLEGLHFQIEEDNLIEIDISPARGEW